jgi:hypothetical protein
MSLLQNATCLAYEWKSEIIEGCLSYKVLIDIIVLSLSDSDQTTFFPTNRQNKYGTLLCRVYSRHFVQCVRGKADLLFKLAAFQRKGNQLKNDGLRRDKFESVFTKPPSVCKLPKFNYNYV